ncbi:hypothetical protein [Alteraurantiacibacter aestuarii]|uniref:Uncharacterized protein n=1 Tax=Alteraurantiacibacter aestuarii TaxID=650004 RepID=A0A844ZL37_9SPHN|nr:hypothetical protein [Alteraurantiacibacter aestuarii]MXO87992.1 hypothetical protein [Alteraurantiacibacter aestuarii]
MSGAYCACPSDDICADEDVMLAELAATLYAWPNRNIVFEKAIHAVALELLAMAQHAVAEAPGD